MNSVFAFLVSLHTHYYVFTCDSDVKLAADLKSERGGSSCSLGT